MDELRLQALLKAYQEVRPLTGAEHTAWPGVLRMAALRFWLSRLHDMYFPQDGELIYAKDPVQFEKILKHHIQQQ
jgi:homoserine kinase type II